MLRSSSGLGLVVAGSLLASCGSDSGGRSLVITNPVAQPGTSLVFCSGDDESETLDGVQQTVQVSAAGFRDGAVVLIAFDGADGNEQLGQQVVAESVKIGRA